MKVYYVDKGVATTREGFGQGFNELLYDKVYSTKEVDAAMSQKEQSNELLRAFIETMKEDHDRELKALKEEIRILRDQRSELLVEIGVSSGADAEDIESHIQAYDSRITAKIEALK